MIFHFKKWLHIRDDAGGEYPTPSPFPASWLRIQEPGHRLVIWITSHGQRCEQVLNSHKWTVKRCEQVLTSHKWTVNSSHHNSCHVVCLWYRGLKYPQNSHHVLEYLSVYLSIIYLNLMASRSNLCFNDLYCTQD